MRKKIIIILIVFLILIFPIRLQYKDGGTIEYRSLTYRIIKWHALDDYYESGFKTGTDFYLFPNNFKSIDYFYDVKPPRFPLMYNNEIYLSNVLSYCWHNSYKAICVDTLGPTDIKYNKTINVEPATMLKYGIAMDISEIELFNKDGVVDYKVEYDNENEYIKVPDLIGEYYLLIHYKCSEGSVGYSFKINIME